MSRRLAFGGPGAEHVRARDLAAQRLDEPLPDADGAWLGTHLAGCPACRSVAAEYDEGRTLLRAARDAAPLPPRDLWARTSAALDQGAGRGGRTQRRGLAGLRRLPLAPVAAVLVVAVAVGAGLLNGVGPFPFGLPGTPQPTPFAVTAGEFRMLTLQLDGSLSVSTRRYEEVCPVEVSSCTTTTTDGSTLATRLADLGSVDAYLSPSQDHLVVLQKGSASGGVFVVPVNLAPTPSPTAPASAIPSETAVASGSAAPSANPDSSGPPVSPAVSPSLEPSPTPTPKATPGASDTASPGPSGSVSPSPSVEVSPEPDGTIQIARDVIVIGDISGYSADGTRFAFTARPADGSAGPDIYVWNTAETLAHPATTDHASLFAGWAGNSLLVSRVMDGIPATALLDPATGVETAIAAGTAWRPAPGPGGTTAVWWDGTVTRSEDGHYWVPAVGRLVLGAWPGAAAAIQPSPGPSSSGTSATPPGPSPAAASTSEPTTTPDATPSSEPTATPEAPTPAPTVTPASTGTPGDTASPGASASPTGSRSPSPSLVPPTGAFELQVLETGPVRDWQVRWDATGTSLAVWVTNDAPGLPGRLSLYSVDPVTGKANLAHPMLSNAVAYEGFSLVGGRLTWSAPTRNGEAAVEVLAWSGDSIGRLEMTVGKRVTLIR